MMKMYSPDGNTSMPVDETLVLNGTNPLIKKVSATLNDETRTEINSKLAKQIYSLALISQRQLNADELKGYISNTVELFEML